MKALSYELWDEDEQTCDDGDDGGYEHRAGGEVFNDLYFGMPFFRNLIGESFDAAVDNFRNPDEAGDDGEDGCFHAGDLQDYRGDDDGDGGREMDAGIVLAPDELADPADGMGEADETAADGESFLLHHSTGFNSGYVG